MLISGSVKNKFEDQNKIDFWANQTDGWEWALGLLHLTFFGTMSYEFNQINSMELSLRLKPDTKTDIGLPQDNKSINTEFENIDEATQEEPL